MFHSVLQRLLAAQIPCASVLQVGCAQLKPRVFREFRKTGKSHIRAVSWQFWTYFQFIGPPLSGRLLVVGVD